MYHLFSGTFPVGSDWLPTRYSQDAVVREGQQSKISLIIVWVICTQAQVIPFLVYNIKIIYGKTSIEKNILAIPLFKGRLTKRGGFKLLDVGRLGRYINKVQNIGILEEIDSIYSSKMLFL